MRLPNGVPQRTAGYSFDATGNHRQSHEQPLVFDAATDRLVSRVTTGGTHYYKYDRAGNLVTDAGRLVESLRSCACDCCHGRRLSVATGGSRSGCKVASTRRRGKAMALPLLRVSQRRAWRPSPAVQPSSRQTHPILPVAPMAPITAPRPVPS
jgi:YD repeat-containing protein